MRKNFRITAVLALGMLFVLLMTGWTLRTGLVRLVANWILAADNMVLTQLAPLEIDSTAARTARIELQLPSGQKLIATDLHVSYRLNSWLQAPLLETIAAGSVELRASADATDSENSDSNNSQPLLVSSALQVLREFPLTSASINELTLPYYSKPLRLDFHHDSGDLLVNIDNTELQFTARFTQTDAAATARLQAALARGDARVGDFEVALTPGQMHYAVQGQGHLQFADLNSLLGQLQQTASTLPLQSANLDWTLTGAIADDVAGTFAADATEPATFTLGMAAGSTFTLALPADNIAELTATLKDRAEFNFSTGVGARISMARIAAQTNGRWDDAPFGTDGVVSLADCSAAACRMNFDGNVRYDMYEATGVIDVALVSNEDPDSASQYQVKTSGLVIGGLSQWFPAFDIDARLSINDDQLDFDTPLLPRGTPDNAGVTMTGRYNFTSGAVAAHVALPALAFSDTGKALSHWLPGWPYSFDLLSGSLTADADIEWQPGTADNADVLSANVQFAADNLGGFYRDIFFRGLNSSVDGSYDSSAVLPLDTPDLVVTLDGVDVGIPITDVRAAFRFNRANSELLVSSLSAATLDGTLGGNNLRYVFGADRNDLTLSFNGLRIERMMELADYDGVKAAGAVSGELPLTLTPTGVEVAAGSLRADAPGGTIRYLSTVGNAGDPGIDLVNKALANYQYDSLVSSITYSPAGELVLGMQLQGTNPEMSKDQRINLNLNLTDNIPDLMKSLQAARNIEDFLQQQYK